MAWQEDRTEPKSDWKKEVEGEGRGNEKAEKKKGKTIPNCSFWSLEEEKGLRTTYKNKLHNVASCRIRSPARGFSSHFRKLPIRWCYVNYGRNPARNPVRGAIVSLAIERGYRIFAQCFY
jgi:hypothetical protein